MNRDRVLSGCIAMFWALSLVTVAGAIDKSALVGKWEYTSYTLLEKGKSSGTIQFKPGTLFFTYHQDGTWGMEANDATHTRLDGTYELHGAELIMRKGDGSPYQDFNVELKSGGKEMVLKDKRSIISASKVEAAP